MWLKIIWCPVWDMWLKIIWCPVCGIINFEIGNSFLIKLLFYITKKSGQKCKYLKNEKSFWHKIKKFFHRFLRAFIEVNKSSFFGRWKSNFKLPLYFLARFIFAEGTAFWLSLNLDTYTECYWTKISSAKIWKEHTQK